MRTLPPPHYFPNMIPAIFAPRSFFDFASASFDAQTAPIASTTASAPASIFAPHALTMRDLRASTCACFRAAEKEAHQRALAQATGSLQSLPQGHLPESQPDEEAFWVEQESVEQQSNPKPAPAVWICLAE